MLNTLISELRRAPVLDDPGRILQAHSVERRFLVIAALFLLVNTLSLWILRGDVADFWHGLAWGACAVFGHLVLNWRLPDRDPLLFPLAMFMAGWGIIAISRLQPPFADRQSIWLIVALCGMLAISWTRALLRLMRAFRYLLLFGGLAVLAVTIQVGINPSDPEGVFGAPALWIALGSLYIQPSEGLKIILVVFLASYLAEQYPTLRAEGLHTGRGRITVSPRILGPIALMWGLCVVVLVWQRDLGTAALFFIVFLVLLYTATGYTFIVYSGVLMLGAVGVIAYQLFAVVRLRIDIWWNPWLEAEGRAYQIVQSLMAFAAGGVFGQGIGQGAPGFIPVVHSDFMYAALAEEWGLIGALAVLVCLAVFSTRGIRIAIGQRGKPYQTLLAVGLSTLIAAQSLLIMGGVLKLIPLTGVTLPFFSYGGSSLVVTFLITGLLLRLSAREV
ncbi:MAG: FtsW/RodA/SpoVE family cell cycle protein [bacterium]|nr:FtsW/RodA/SpoVE family cell cycle protein [bacterium]